MTTRRHEGDGDGGEGWPGRFVDFVDRSVPASMKGDPTRLLRARLLLVYSAVIVAICPVFVGLPLRQGRHDLATITAVAMLLGALPGPLLRRTGFLDLASSFTVTT